MAPEFCQSCHERRWACIILKPMRYICWFCYTRYKRVPSADAESA
jgi:hypothetical protein